MLLLVVGLVIFLGIHLLPTNAKLRDGLVAKYGEVPFKAVFSILSLIGFVLIIYGYHKLQMEPSKNPLVFGVDAPTWTKHISFLLMIPAMILLVAAYIPSRIRSATKHPMLAAVKIWAVAHLIANWDLGSFVLFGSFLAYGVYDRISLKRRGNTGPGPANVSIVNDVAVVGIGLALYAFLLFWGHGYLIGVGLIG